MSIEFRAERHLALHSAARRFDGPSEGRHSAFPCAPLGAFFLGSSQDRRAGARQGRQNALPPKRGLLRRGLPARISHQTSFADDDHSLWLGRYSCVLWTHSCVLWTHSCVLWTHSRVLRTRSLHPSRHSAQVCLRALQARSRALRARCVFRRASWHACATQPQRRLVALATRSGGKCGLASSGGTGHQLLDPCLEVGNPFARADVGAVGRGESPDVAVREAGFAFADIFEPLPGAKDTV